MMLIEAGSRDCKDQTVIIHRDFIILSNTKTWQLQNVAKVSTIYSWQHTLSHPVTQICQQPSHRYICIYTCVLTSPPILSLSAINFAREPTKMASNAFTAGETSSDEIKWKEPIITNTAYQKVRVKTIWKHYIKILHVYIIIPMQR